MRMPAASLHVARRMQTGRLNFYRNWGPLEPDDGFAGQMKAGGTYSHLVSTIITIRDGRNHHHTLYNSWEFVRGQGSDPWTAMANTTNQRFRTQYHPIQFEDHRDGHRLQGMINRTRITADGFRW